MSKYKCLQIKGEFFYTLFCGFRKPHLELLGFDWSQIICSAYIYIQMPEYTCLSVCIVTLCVLPTHTACVYYHWRELPQVSFLSWQKCCHDKLTFVMTTRVCHSKTCLLSQQKYACHDKTFVETKLCLPRQTHAKVNLSWQNFMSGQYYACCDKCLSGQNFCHDKSMSVATNTLSQEAYFCHDKRRVLS